MRRALATLALVAVGTSASANGRFPDALDLSFQRGGAGRISGSTTFGLLFSDDLGDTWQWVCEDAVGYAGEWNPQVVITQPGTILVSTTEALRISRDGGCTFMPGPGAMATAWVADLQQGEDGSIWIASANSSGVNDVYVSRDDGVSFEPAGLAVPSAFWLSVRTAPGDVERVYASGYDLVGGVPMPMLHRRDATGWMALPFEYEGESQLKLLGVSPSDPDLVFARIDGEPTDTVLSSSDGGISWTQGPSLLGDVVAFAAWPDGEVLIGTKYEGSHRSTDGGLTWTQVSERLKSPWLNCAAISPTGELWGCGSNWEPDRFAYGRSTDRGETWSRVMRFDEIRTALDCPDATPQDELCEPNFDSAVCTTFSCRVDAPPRPPDAPPIDAGGPPGREGGSGCGCGIALGAVVGFPLRWRRRARR